MNETPTILVVDDDPAHRTMLQTLLKGWGYAIETADDGDAAIARVEAGPFDLILMDIRMLRVSGIEALDRIKAINPAIPVIIMTAYSSVETAVETLKKGAHDYLTKPLDFDKLRVTLQRSMGHARPRKSAGNDAQPGKGGDGARPGNGGDGFRRIDFDHMGLIAKSPAMLRLLDIAAQVAPTEATVMISGESGAGKELIAGIIHHNSPREKGPFVKINCGAITETLLESELFGHEKGAFTGADRRKEGRFVQASGGSLFLDEVGEMPLTMQAKLLRVLQEREVTRVGGETVIPVDTRVITATNRDLPAMIAAGEFREDLYYRLNVVDLKIPPLRRRREDIPPLATLFLGRFSEKNRKTIEGLAPAAMDLLNRAPWPGNVRQLMNAVERAVVLSRSAWLDVADFQEIAEEAGPAGAADAPAETPPGPSAAGEVSLEEMEKTTILSTMAATGGNKSEAARRLGITRKTLHSKLKKFEIT